MNTVRLFFLQALFELMDANKDGVIQRAEWVYAMLQHDFVGGPDSLFSQLCGFVDGENLMKAESHFHFGAVDISTAEF